MSKKLHGPGPEIADSGEEYIAPVTRKQQKDPFIRHLDKISGHAIDEAGCDCQSAEPEILTGQLTDQNDHEEVEEQMYGLQKQLIPHPATDAEFTSGMKDWGPRSRSIQAFGGAPTQAPDTNDDKFGEQEESLQTVGGGRGNYRGFAGVPSKGNDGDELWFPQQSEPAEIAPTGNAVDTIRRKVMLRVMSEAGESGKAPEFKPKKVKPTTHPSEKEKPAKLGGSPRRSAKKVRSLQPAQKRQTDRPDLDQRFKGVLKYANIIDARLATEKMNEFWKEYMKLGDREALRRLKSLAVVAQNRAQFRYRDEGHTEAQEIYRHYDAWLTDHPMPHEIVKPAERDKSAVIKWRIKFRADGWHKDVAEIEAVQLKTAIARLKKELGEKFDDFKIIGAA